MSRGVSVKDLNADALRRLGVKSKAKPRDLEHAEQRMLIEWCDNDITRSIYPELALLYAIPNFSGRMGNATARHGARLKAEGRRKGVPDLCLPVSRGGYHGLYLEMKAAGGSLTREQVDWIAALRGQGYKAVCVKGFAAARFEIVAYLELPR